MQALARLYGTGVRTVAAGMLAAIFVTFLYQIVARYILGLSVGWTIELNLTLWLWLVLFSCAFVLRERDHVKFDLLYQHVRPGTRRVFAILSALAIVAALAAAMADTWEYVDFYRIKKSATLRWRLDHVFSIYLVFAVVIVLRYAWRTVAILRGRDLSLDERDPLAD
jgi:TRAP-type C4-dicarboxylate transport system permease small subunit